MSTSGDGDEVKVPKTHAKYDTKDEDDGSIQLIEPEEDDDIQDEHLESSNLENSHDIKEAPAVKPVSEPCLGGQSPRQRVPSKASQANNASRERPPSRGRRPRQRSGSLRLTRTQGPRIAQSVMDWGNSSTPSMGNASIEKEDLAESERNWTQVGLAEQSPRRRRPVKAKSMNVRNKQKSVRERRKDVKNSLTVFTKKEEEDEADKGKQEEQEEDDSLISEVEIVELEEGEMALAPEKSKKEARKAKRDDIVTSDHEKSDGEGDKSIKSQRNQTPTRYRVRRSANKDEEGGGNSNHSRKRTNRRSRLRGRGGDGDDDKSVASTATGTGARRERSRRMSRRTAGGRRSLGDSHSVDGSELQNRSRPSNNYGDSASVDGSTRNRRSRRPSAAPGDDTDDNRSVGSRGSRKSVGRRRRRKPDVRPLRTRSSAAAKEYANQNLTGWKSPMGKKRPSIGGSEDEDGSEEMTKPSSIPRRISVQPESTPPCIGDLDESSNSESSDIDPLDENALIQFDPKNENYIIYVNQSKGNTTSETYKNSDGSMYESFIVTELVGLPTFEKPRSELTDSTRSGLSDDSPAQPTSTKSLGQSSVGKKEGTTETAKARVRPGRTTPRKAESFNVTPRKVMRSRSGGATGFFQKMRDRQKAAASPAAGTTTPASNPGETGGDLNKSMSFFSAMRVPKPTASPAVAPSRAAASPAAENGGGDLNKSAILDLNKSMNFFSAWKKKEKEETDDDDEEEDGVGFFKKREANTHQALDDDGSEHD